MRRIGRTGGHVRAAIGAMREPNGASRVAWAVAAPAPLRPLLPPLLRCRRRGVHIGATAEAEDARAAVAPPADRATRGGTSCDVHLEAVPGAGVDAEAAAGEGVDAEAAAGSGVVAWAAMGKAGARRTVGATASWSTVGKARRGEHVVMDASRRRETQEGENRGGGVGDLEKGEAKEVENVARGVGGLGGAEAQEGKANASGATDTARDGNGRTCGRDCSSGGSDRVS